MAHKNPLPYEKEPGVLLFQDFDIVLVAQDYSSQLWIRVEVGYQSILLAQFDPHPNKTPIGIWTQVTPAALSYHSLAMFLCLMRYK